MTRFLQFLQLTGLTALAIAVFLLHGTIDSINEAKDRDNVLSEEILQLRSALETTNVAVDVTDRRISDVAGNLYSDFSALGASLAIETPVALFETSLANPISSSASTMTLNSATTKDGTTLASSTYSFIIDEGTTNEEFVKADCTSTACTNMVRGISALTGTSTVTALQKAHRRGASVKITDAPLLVNITRILNGIGTVPNILSYTSHPTFTVGTQIIDKTYADNLAIAGVATSSESNFGGVWLGTALQQASSTNGGTNQPWVMQTRYATDTPQSGCAVGYTSTAGAGCSVIAQLTGKIRQGWLNLAESFTWTGTQTFSATTTATGATIGFGTFAQMAAGTALTGNTTPQPVFVSTTTDQLLLSDANDNMASQFAGFALDTVASGATTTVQFSGVVAGFSGLTRGSKYYVQDAVGTIGATAGTNEVIVGTAISATEILIEADSNWVYVGSNTCDTIANCDIVGPSVARFAVVDIVTGSSAGCSGPSAMVDAKERAVVAKNGGTTATFQASPGCTGAANPSGNYSMTAVMTSTSSVRVTVSAPATIQSKTQTAYFYR